MSNLFASEGNLRIGTVFEVNGTCIKVALKPNRDELTRLYQGRVYAIGEIGSLIRMRFGRRILFGTVRSLRLQTEEEAAAVSAAIDAERRVLEADLMGEGAWDHETSSFVFQRGLTSSALPMQDAYIVSDEELEVVYSAIEQQTDPDATLVTIGEIASSARIPARANIDLMFGHHCAVLGSTGSGKSSAVAAILRAVLDAPLIEGGEAMKPRIILVDPHGEYGRAFVQEAVVYRAYDALGHAEGDAEELRLPYWLLSSDEFRSLVVGKTEFEATSQANVVYKALTHARMVAAGLIEPARDWIGADAAVTDALPDDPRPIGNVDIEGFDRDKPIRFSMAEFRAHIEKEQCVRFQKNKWERVTDSDWEKNFVGILSKLKVLERDPRIRFLMRCEDEITLSQIMSQFFGDHGDNRNLRIVDISGLPNEVAGPLTAAIARTVFGYKLHQSDEERREDPLLLVCEEAHRYVPNAGEAQYSSAQAAIRRVAREGRKYGLGLLLVSQRPSDLEGTVLSQCGTWLVLRLSNASDQAHVARFLPDSLATMVSMLPSLPRREALFVGEGAALPSRIRIRYLEVEQRPKSDDVAFGSGWRHPFPSAEKIDTICNRMVSQQGLEDAAGEGGE
jgi:uncharacterized protein